MVYCIGFWRERELTLDEIKLLVTEPTLIGMNSFIQSGRYDFDFLHKVQKDFDKKIKKINPIDIQRKGFFSTVSNPLPKDTFFSVDINHKIKSTDWNDTYKEHTSKLSDAQLEKFVYKEFPNEPEKWWSSPKEIKELLKDKKLKTQKQLKKLLDEGKYDEYNKEEIYLFYKKLADLGFYVAIL